MDVGGTSGKFFDVSIAGYVAGSTGTNGISGRLPASKWLYFRHSAISHTLYEP